MVDRRGVDTGRGTETGTDRSEIWHGVREAHAGIRGEHQIAEYVANLEIGECARILASDPEGLPRLAALRDECRVERDEARSFERVIRPGRPPSCRERRVAEYAKTKDSGGKIGTAGSRLVREEG